MKTICTTIRVLKLGCCGFMAAALLGGAGCKSPAPVPANEHLSVPAESAAREYLGIPANKEVFDLKDIQCELLVIDCFDMYCHVCQLSAPHVNALYKLAQDEGVGGRIKFVGLGVGDTPLETSTYKQKFHVPFPVFPDRHASIARQFGEVRLPNLLVAKKCGNDLQVKMSFTGYLPKVPELLLQLKAELGKTNQLQTRVLSPSSLPVGEELSEQCSNTCTFRNREKSASAM